jgi:alkylation response protein AidB-like acyl-CoA dehydrogenase
MDFRLSNEQQMLKDSARGYLAEPGHERWSTFAELGWLAMPAPEDTGGFGSSFEDIAVLSEELGRALAPEPFIGGALLPIRIIDLSGAKARHR